MVEGFVGLAAQVNARTAAIYRILVSAAASDPDAATLLDELTRQRQDGQGRIARSLSRARALRTGLRERDAGDIIHALLSPELYGLLVVDRGWPPERYQIWLTDTLADHSENFPSRTVRISSPNDSIGAPVVTSSQVPLQDAAYRGGVTNSSRFLSS